MRRPEFISRSRQRVRRLALQVEERRLQAVFEERDELFNQPRGLERMLKPSGNRSEEQVLLVTVNCRIISVGYFC